MHPQNPKERVKIALSGSKPDRAPIVPIFDYGFIMKINHQDPRERFICSNEDLIRYNEQAFLRFALDGFFVHFGIAEDWYDKHQLKKFPTHWEIISRQTGQKWHLLPDGQRIEVADNVLTKKALPVVSNQYDLQKYIQSACSENEYDKPGKLAPLIYLAKKYPEHHFSAQVDTPFIEALSACGGFEQGLIMMVENRQLFIDLLKACTQKRLWMVDSIKKAGADSVWFTSYYTGADIISPRDYAEILFPFEYQICQKARQEGLYVLNWYLGDLMPMLNHILQLPLDALVLEQGRRGYVIDPVQIRQQVGDKFCLFGYVYEEDLIDFNQKNIEAELIRQFQGAGKNGAFVVGSPIVPPNANIEAVSYYFDFARKYCRYSYCRTF